MKIKYEPEPRTEAEIQNSRKDGIDFMELLKQHEELEKELGL